VATSAPIAKDARPGAASAGGHQVARRLGGRLPEWRRGATIAAGASLGVVIAATSAGAQTEAGSEASGVSAASSAGLSTQVLVVLAILAVGLIVRQRLRLRRTNVPLRR
jgi:hypothetical protein